jgi:pimeloyl-ACP methyl ester carboxylesterase
MPTILQTCLIFAIHFAPLPAASQVLAQAPDSTKTGSSIQLHTPTGTLDGSLDLPAGAEPFPVVIMIAGSGPTDRDGNQKGMKNDSLKSLGLGLAGKGIAVLRYDRRAVGKSATAWTKKEADFRFDMLADDVVDWIKLLRKDKRFTKVGIIGHSEGALVGMLAAKQEKVDAYVSLAGAGRSLPTILREQLAKNLPKNLQEESDHIIDELIAGRTVENPPPALKALFRPGVQPFLISEFKHDPGKEIATLDAPTLIVQGTTDAQISVEDAKCLAAAKKDAKLVVIKGMNHVLRAATNNIIEQQFTYITPKPIVPEVIDKIANFLKETLKQSAVPR